MLVNGNALPVLEHQQDKLIQEKSLNKPKNLRQATTAGRRAQSRNGFPLVGAMLIIFCTGPASREIIFRGLQPFAVLLSLPFPLIH